MVEDVPLELGHGLLRPPGTCHAEEEEQDELTTGHPDNRPGLTDNRGPDIRHTDIMTLSSGEIG